jgi:MFS family permease
MSGHTTVGPLAAAPLPMLLPAVLGAVLGLSGAGNSAVAVVLSELADDMGIDSAASVWTMTIFALTLAVSTPIYGRVADMVGVRAPLAVGITMMSVGAALAAVAWTFPILLLGRALQGLGAGAVPVLAPAAVAAVAHRQAPALARLGAVGVCVGTLGPLLGGALEAVANWRWAMLAPAVGMLAIPATWRAMPSRGVGGRLDVVGAGAVVVAVSGLVLLVQSPSVGYAAGLGGLVLLAAGFFAVVKSVRTKPDGFLPRALVTDPVLIRLALPGGAVPAAWFGLMLGIPTMLSARGWEPLEIGLLLAPGSAVGLVAPRMLRSQLSRFDLSGGLAISCLLTAVALVVSGLGGALGLPVAMAVGMATMSLAFAIGQPAFMACVAAHVPAQVRGVALGIASLAFLTGCSVGSAWVGGIGHATTIWLSIVLLAVLPLSGAPLVASSFRSHNRLRRVT